MLKKQIKESIIPMKVKESQKQIIDLIKQRIKTIKQSILKTKYSNNQKIKNRKEEAKLV